MRKRVLALTMAALLAVSFAGCKKSDNSSEQATSQTTTNYWDNIQVGEDISNETEDASVGGDSSIEVQTGENGEDVVIIDMDGNPEKVTDSNGKVVESTTGENKNKNDNKKENTNPEDGDVINIGDIDSGKNKSDKNKNNNNNNNNNKNNNNNNNSNNNNQGENASEEYPGQNEGWSPIVRPEDLNN